MVKVNALTTQTTIADDDLLFVNDHGRAYTGNEAGESRNITVATLRRYLRGEYQVTIANETIVYLTPTAKYKPTQTWPQQAENIWDFTQWDEGRFAWFVKSGFDPNDYTLGGQTHLAFTFRDLGTSPGRQRFTFDGLITDSSNIADEEDPTLGEPGELTIASGDEDLIENSYFDVAYGEHPRLILINRTGVTIDVWVCFYG